MTGDGADKVDALAETLDALDEHLRYSDDAVRRSVRYRLSLLHLHAVFAMYIGAWFTRIEDTTMAGAAWSLIRAVPGNRFTLGGLLLFGGLVLGVSTWRRHLGGEVAGLCLLLCWYLTITVSFAGGLIWWELGFFPPDTTRPAPYAHGVYGHLGSIMIIHIFGLLRIRAARRGRP